MTENRALGDITMVDTDHRLLTCADLGDRAHVLS